MDGKHKRRDSIFERLQVDIQHLCLSKFLLGFCNKWRVNFRFWILVRSICTVACLNVVGMTDYSQGLLGRVNAACVCIYIHIYIKWRFKIFYFLYTYSVYNDVYKV